MKRETFDKELKNLGLSKQQFADITGLSVNSVRNWHDVNKPIPSWIESWIENYKGNKNWLNIVNAVTPYIPPRND